MVFKGAGGGRLGKTTGFRRPSQACFAAPLMLEILHRRPARVKAAFDRRRPAGRIILREPQTLPH
jgi:hypothetical protein